MVGVPSSCAIISREDQRRTDHNHHHHHHHHRASRTTKSGSTTTTGRKRDDDEDDVKGCSGQSCASCTASCVADCVAVCCCPCAIVNLLVLAFVKVPCLMGKRCVRLVRDKGRESSKKKMKKKKNVEENKECLGADEIDGDDEKGIGSTRRGGDEENNWENLCERYEAERGWWELYQAGHWGFGRISCSGDHPG